MLDPNNATYHWQLAAVYQAMDRAEEAIAEYEEVLRIKPGYTLISALFPKRTSLGSIERIALSFGLSIAVVPLIGLILNYTPRGIRLYPILIALFAFMMLMSFIAWIRRSSLLPSEQMAISLNIDLSSFTLFKNLLIWEELKASIKISASSR